MKILELRFKNLNSLYGEWRIDFTESEYAFNGIFALIGPTGAGKSTILDAICLALYGSTPRLGRITQSSNDIMSRQTGECFAEVVFASQAGRFRCHWAQHRSRKKADGDLQNPRHEISEANAEGKVIENQLKSVLGAVEDTTGMDFDRFTRSILLAQGGFDTFLKATVEQKSKILEQITGTKIYSDISIGVHERLRDEKAILSTLEAESRGIHILTPEEEYSTEEELKLSQLKEKNLGTLVSDFSKAIVWLNDIAQLKQETRELAEEERILIEDTLAFLPNRTILDSASKAATLEGAYATFSGLRQQQKEDQNSLQIEKDALPALESDADIHSECLVKAEELTEQAKTAQQKAVPTLRKVRALDQNLAQLTTSIKENETAIVTNTETITSYQMKRDIQEEKVAIELKKRSDIETYCTGHASDKNLISELTGLNEQIQSLSSKQKEVDKHTDENTHTLQALKIAKETLTICSTQTIALQTKHDTAREYLQNSQADLSVLLGNKLLREYRSEKDSLLREREYLARIAALEEHRNHLVEGKACPLCGSIEHPFAVGNMPTSNETEAKITTINTILREADNLETKIQELVVREQDASTALTNHKTNETEAFHAKENAQFAYTRSVEKLQEAQKAFSSIETAVAEKLKAYGMEEIEKDLTTLLESLRDRKNTWLAKEEEKKTIDNTINSIKGEIQRLNGVITTQKTALQEKHEALKILANSFATVKAERQELFGVKDADEKEENLAKVVRDAEDKEKEARKASTDSLEKVSISKTRIDSLQDSLTKRMIALEMQEALFLKELTSVGFSNEDQFLSARLPIVERNRLELEAKTLDDRQTALRTKQHDRNTRLTIELSKNMTDLSLAELQPVFQEKEAELKECRDTVAEYKAKLKENNTAKERIDSKQEIIRMQKQECAKWDRLHSLIGSSDGKKFRNFAQGLTFELMVSHANRQLAKMSDRYLLIRDTAQPLELNVIDNYQGGEIRSTKNLSGGESFIVSLTLALGLSQMASRKVRVDSLFLDEGFGTLDEDSLEIALKTLSNLQQDGKLIGVISHVSAMQEMIRTQISITPTLGGRSILTGPGCSKVPD